MGNLSYETILAYSVGILLLFLVAKAFQVPFKLLSKVGINCSIGGIVLIMINYFGNYINFHLPLNPVTSLITGFLGIPGLILIFVLTKLF